MTTQDPKALLDKWGASLKQKPWKIVGDMDELGDILNLARKGLEAQEHKIRGECCYCPMPVYESQSMVHVWEDDQAKTAHRSCNDARRADRAEKRIAALEGALRDIKYFAEGHHGEQPINVLIHSLTVDIPHYCDVAMEPDHD